MEPVEFKAKMNDVGYNFASFAKLCGVNRSTIIRYCQGAYTPIPTVYCNILNWLEDGQLKVSKPKLKSKAKPKSKDTLDD
jgi:transcriptional regulator with XRE-family HTH domain